MTIGFSRVDRGTVLGKAGLALIPAQDWHVSARYTKQPTILDALNGAV